MKGNYNLQDKTIGFISLGCPKALVDSERIMTQLYTDGYSIVNSYEDANLVIVNTCGFIDDAVTESLNAIGEAIEKNGRVIVTGCLGKTANKVLSIHDKVLAISGPQDYETVMRHVYEHLPKPKKNPLIDLVPEEGIKLTPKHYAYIKISEGCNHNCQFCIIPDLRGPLKSRDITKILSEAERLQKSGTKELLIISQDTSAYGSDLGYPLTFHGGRPVKTNLVSLCEELAQLDIWIRLHYIYPYPNVDNIIPLMAEGKILPYLDIPFQHADYDVLKRMRRPAYAEKVLNRLSSWRNTCPDIAIRSTFITGFPGETEEQFQTLLNFLSEAKLDRVGAFAYSNVKEAASYSFANQVDEEIKQDRLKRLMQHQAEISKNKLKEKIGTIQPVIIDFFDKENLTAVGRTIYDAPEVDGQVIIYDIDNPPIGDVIHVEIEDSNEHDLFATPI